MKETGDLLRKIREEKGISIEDVVLATKIKKSTIKAIEEGDLKELPSKTFIRGFVQSYAKYLQTDLERVLEVFHAEMGTTVTGIRGKAEAHDTASDEDAVKFANSNRHPLIKFFIALGAIVLIALIYVVGNTIDKYQTEKQLIEPTQKEAKNIVPIQDDSEDSQSPTKEATGSEKVETEEEDQSDASTAIDNKNVAEAAIKAAEEKAAVDKRVAEERAKAEAAAKSAKEKKLAEEKRLAEEKAKADADAKAAEEKKLAEEKRLADEKKAAEEKEAEEKRLAEEKAKAEAEEKEDKPEVLRPKKVQASFIPQEVIIEALDTVKLSFRSDDGSWVDIELKPEQIHTIKGRNTIELKVSDGGAVNIIHNGKVKGVPGTLGSSINLKFP